MLLCRNHVDKILLYSSKEFSNFSRISGRICRVLARDFEGLTMSGFRTAGRPPATGGNWRFWLCLWGFVYVGFPDGGQAAGYGWQLAGLGLALGVCLCGLSVRRAGRRLRVAIGGLALSSGICLCRVSGRRAGR